MFGSMDSNPNPSRKVAPIQEFEGPRPTVTAAHDLLIPGRTRDQSITMASVQRTNRRRLKSLAIIALGAALAALGVYNLVLKATWTLMDDGVFWKAGPEGVVAHRVAAGGPAARAGVQPGDVLLAIDGEETLRPGQVEDALRRQPGGPATYSLLRLGERRGLEVRVRPLAQGNVALFCYLSLVGFFSLAVGTIVMLRRPAERATLHFYAICVLFFLVYSTSYTGSLDAGDWVLFWTDHLAVLFLPVVFLHFCMSFPEAMPSPPPEGTSPASGGSPTPSTVASLSTSPLSSRSRSRSSSTPTGARARSPRAVR